MHRATSSPEVFGGQAKIAFASAEGGVRVAASGTANLAQLQASSTCRCCTRISGTTE